MKIKFAHLPTEFPDRVGAGQKGVAHRQRVASAKSPDVCEQRSQHSIKSDNQVEDKKWCIVSAKPRQEMVALSNLENQGYQVYLPRISMQKRRRDKWRSVSEPLFPGYLFVQLSLGQDSVASIRSTYGVLGLVRFGAHIPSLDGSLIDWFKQQERQQSEQPQAADDLFKPGAPVAILAGPFAGLQAVYEMSVSSERALLLINLLGGETRLHCHLHDIAPV